MKTILLVDDSTTMLMSMEAILKRAGFSVETASSGDAALSKLKMLKPDLMITDLNMPGMDGISLIKAVKQLPAMKFKPVLMMTTESQQAKRDEAKAAGAVGWLVKPVEANQLLAVIKQILPGT
ncbi:MAG: response regulator [Enterobacterales bacterium]|nr:response regulator [Enterobacterales bacterium]